MDVYFYQQGLKHSPSMIQLWTQISQPGEATCSMCYFSEEHHSKFSKFVWKNFFKKLKKLLRKFYIWDFIIGCVLSLTSGTTGLFWHDWYNINNWRRKRILSKWKEMENCFIEHLYSLDCVNMVGWFSSWYNRVWYSLVSHKVNFWSYSCLFYGWKVVSTHIAWKY